MYALLRSFHATVRACASFGAKAGRLISRRIQLRESSSAGLPFIGTIDSPRKFWLGGVPMTIGGWAVGSSKVSEVEIFVDELPLGKATIGLSRPGIARARQHYPFAGTSGFQSSKHITIPKKDAVKIKALVHLADGQKHEITSSLRAFASAAAALQRLNDQRRARADSYVELAKLLIDAHDLAQAELAVQATRARWPELPEGYVQHSRLLIRQNRTTEADALLAAGVKRFPNNATLLGSYAKTASRRGDWQTAVSRWRTVRERFPDYIGLAYEESVAQLGAATEAALVADVEPTNAAINRIEKNGSAASSRDTHAALMLHFENLGTNCEFGLVQHHYGSEPLGLLRFASTSLEALIKALDCRFEGVGHPDNTKFALLGADSGARAEYRVWDARYNFGMHTFIHDDIGMSQETYDKLYRQQCRRLAFLKDKLISDLETPDKMFVFQQPQRLSDGEIGALLRAIRAYGPGALLSVRPQEERHPAGTVEMAEDGLLIGYLDRFFSLSSPPSFDTWLKICLAADQMWQRPNSH